MVTPEPRRAGAGRSRASTSRRGLRRGPGPARLGASRWIWAAVLATSLLAPGPARARDLFESEDGEYRLVLRSSLKGSWLLSIPQDDPLLEESPGGGAFFRLRFELASRVSQYVSVQVAYEHRALASSASSVGVGLLPPALPAPFRLRQLDWAIVDQPPGYAHRHELDRGFVALHLPFLELTMGRQAIGLGRGVLFSAIDLFSPFSPTEIDREWRRGVDAVQAELRIPELSAVSADFIAALGAIEAGGLESWAMLGRVRAVVGDVDGELIGGRRGEDELGGAALSATVGDAEVHGELALFHTDGEGVEGGLFDTDGLVAKGLAGGSYMFDVWRGLRIVFEYHYSGFGVANVGRSADILFDPAFQARVARGDTQILGRHALALVLSSDLLDELGAALAYLQSPKDGSGSIAPTLTWIRSDAVTLVLSALFPWGASPLGGVPRSDFGGSPLTVFLQARFYD